MIRIDVSDRARSRVPAALFSHFPEKTRGIGEKGIEGCWDAERGGWWPGFVDRVSELHPARLRFPGGGIADRMDWRWGMDNVPGVEGRFAEGDFTNHVGTDEFIDLCRRVGAAPWIVVNVGGFKDGPEAGAALAADWVEYCNAPADGTNPCGDVDWAAIRAKNGHPEPYNVKLWGLGNELWFFGIEPDDYQKLIPYYMRAMRAVDPTIEFICMGQDERWTSAAFDGAGEALAEVELHVYTFQDVTDDNVSLEDAWHAMMGGPPTHFEVQTKETLDEIARRGATGRVRFTVGEWNVAPWFKGTNPPPRTRYFGMCGAAVLLHEFLRRSGEIDAACMSMLAGNDWYLDLIDVDPRGATPIRPTPFHTLMALYGEKHGTERLDVALRNCPTFDAPRALGNVPARTHIPLLNAVATRSASAVYVHLINADISIPRKVAIHIDEPCADEAVLHRLYAIDGLEKEPAWDGSIRSEEKIFAQEGCLYSVELPPASVAVLEVPRRAKD